MSSSSRCKAIILTTLALAGATGFGIYQGRKSTWHSSPTEIRTSRVWDEAVNPAPLEPPVELPPFEPITVTRNDNHIWIERDFVEGPRYHGGKIGVEAVHAKNGVAELPGGREVALVAAALSIPGNDHPPAIFDPLTGNSLEPEKVASGFSVGSASTSAPRLRLFLQGTGSDQVQPKSIQVFDARTRWPVAQSTSVTFPGENVIADVFLTNWHDTTLKVSIDAVCGTPTRADLPAAAGEQTIIDGSIRFQLGARGTGRVITSDRHGETWQIDLDEENDHSIIGRISPSIWAPHCRLETPGSRSHSQWFQSIPRFQAVHITATAAASSQLTCYPRCARIWFEITRLPGMPNSRELENLFDLRIPTEALEMALGEFMIIADAVQMEDHYSDPSQNISLSEKERGALPPTPKASEILDAFLKSHPDTSVEIDPERHTITCKKRIPIWERIRSWWNAWFPVGWPH